MEERTGQAVGLAPHAVAAGEGEARWWFGGLAVVKATAADTGGQMTILEITDPPGEGPLHVHHTEDEAFWILEGSATFEIGDRTIEARAGDYVFGPRDVPHRYTVGPEGCRCSRATCRTATPSGRRAAGCCSSSPPAGSRSC